MNQGEHMDYLEWLRSFDQDDHGKAALAALADLGRLTGRARDLLLPILTEAVLMARRSDTRGVERAIPVGRVFAGETTLDERRKRLEQTFVLGDGRRVSWLEATEADHLARVEYLQKHVAGLERTINEHLLAVAQLHEFGVSCLGEIGDAA